MQPLTASQLDFVESAISRASYLGAKRALEAAKLKSEIITMAEVRKLYGSAVALDARMSPKIKWIPKGKAGKSSGLYCKESEFDSFLFDKKFDFNTPGL